MDPRAAEKAGPKRRRQRLGPATLLSLLVHLQLIVAISLLAYWKAPRNADLSPQQMIDVTALSEDESRAITDELDRQQAEERKKADEEKKKDEEKPNPDRQVVELSPPANETAPKEARYAAEHDSTVERETHHKGVAAQPRVAPQPTLLAMRAPARPSHAPGAMGTPGASEPQVAGQDPETESLPRQGTPAAPGAPPTKAVPAQPQALALVPSQQTIARALGNGSSDYLPDVDEGEDTALNAKKWKFASFFNRVKEQIRQHWHAAEEYSKRDPTGSMYGGKVRYTLLIVQLEPNGALASVHLEKPSGVDFLDDVAVEAVKQAQPFPNPPQQLVDHNDGKISFRFGFVVDVQGEARLKVFRYSSM